MVKVYKFGIFEGNVIVFTWKLREITKKLRMASNWSRFEPSISQIQCTALSMKQPVWGCSHMWDKMAK